MSEALSKDNLHKNSFFDFFPTPRFLELAKTGVAFSDEDVRLAEYSKDYSALCGLFESLPQKALVDFFTD